MLALAFQESKGGTLTGQKAEAEMISEMKKGNVISEKVLPIFSRMLGEQAAGGIDAYLKTTGAQHNIFKNKVSESVETFGLGGFDEGMMRFFKFLSEFLDRHSGKLRDLGAMFLQLEKSFERLAQGAAPLALLLIPALRILATSFGKIGLLALVLDDISVYVRGGDSVLGKLTGYVSELAGADYNAIATGWKLVGGAIFLALSPLLKVIVAVGALIEAYKYVQGLKQDNSKAVAEGKLPSEMELLEGYTTRQRDATEAMPDGLHKTFSKYISNPVTGAGRVIMPSFSSWAYRDKGTLVDWSAVEGAVAAGDFSEEKMNNLKLAVGTGQMKPHEAVSWFNKQFDPRNGYKAQDVPITVYLNGTFNNQSVNITDILKSKNAFPSQQSQPQVQVPLAK